jgi:hypothetical protein
MECKIIIGRILGKSIEERWEGRAGESSRKTMIDFTDSSPYNDLIIRD